MSYKLIKNGPPDYTLRLKGVEIMVLVQTEKFSVKKIILEPGASTGDISVHEGDEFHLILKGKLVMTLGEERITVEKGEAIQHSSRIPHTWNNGNEYTEILTVNSPPYIYAPR